MLVMSLEKLLFTHTVTYTQDIDIGLLLSTYTYFDNSTKPTIAVIIIMAIVVFSLNFTDFALLAYLLQ